MPVQQINSELIDLLRPFFWHKEDTLPGGASWKLVPQDGAPDPAFYVDNDGDAFAVGDMWLTDEAVFGLDAAGGRLGFYEDGGSLADDLIIVWDADLQIWDGKFTADNAAVFNGESTFNDTVAIEYYCSFAGPVCVLDDWRFRGTVFSDIITLNDDAATYHQMAYYGRLGYMMLWPLSQAYSALYAVALFGAEGTAFITALHNGADVVLSSGAGQLTGTTGADGKFTILATTYGDRVYFENRMGAARKFAVLYFSCQDDTVPWIPAWA